jgi:glycosyltransferase involved in cell wall biosynthesis
MVAEKSVLFVAHSTLRAGATLLLFNFLRWLKLNVDISFQVLVCTRGEMDGEFEELAPVWYLDARPGRKAALRSAVRGLMHGIRASNVVGFGDMVERIGANTRIGLIYSNTVMNGRAVDALLPLGCPVLTHAHELQFAIQTYAGRSFESVKRHTDCFVAVSNAVRSNLVTGHGVPAEKVVCIPGFTPTAPHPRPDKETLKHSLATELGIPQNARIVGGCGVAYWVKGYDIFLQLAISIRARAPTVPVHLVWLGAKPEGRDLYALQHDLAHAGLTDTVHFIGARREPQPYIAAFDVLALVSREEALSLAMLEAAALEVPTVCFAGAGGSSEFVEGDAGFVVPYLDLGAMAERVLELLEMDDLRTTLGRRARKKVLEQHDISAVAPQLLGTIQRMLGTREASPALHLEVRTDR